MGYSTKLFKGPQCAKQRRMERSKNSTNHTSAVDGGVRVRCELFIINATFYGTKCDCIITVSKGIFSRPINSHELLLQSGIDLIKP